MRLCRTLVFVFITEVCVHFSYQLLILLIIRSIIRLIKCLSDEVEGAPLIGISHKWGALYFAPQQAQLTGRQTGAVCFLPQSTVQTWYIRYTVVYCNILEVHCIGINTRIIFWAFQNEEFQNFLQPWWNHSLNSIKIRKIPCLNIYKNWRPSYSQYPVDISTPVRPCKWYWAIE